MTVNFDIDNNFALTYGERHIDLHNNFNFAGYDYNVDHRQMILTWKKSIGSWIKEDELLELKLVHENVTFVNIGQVNIDNTNDDKCLEGITYFSSGDRQINNEFVGQERPADGDDVIYIFTTDDFIRIGCDKIELIAK